MRFSPPDEVVQLYETGFSDDLLGRQKVSKALSGVLDRIEDPLVIALDGRWGTGKSYFLKRWVGAHRLQNEGTAQTIYFDAFAHDYMSDPLIALVSALVERIPKTEEAKLDQLKRIAFRFIKPAARIGLAVVTSGVSEIANGMGDAAAEAVKGEAEKVVDGFWKREEGRQTAMEEFRAAISTLTSAADQQKPIPLVIVIDELDRCRPDYALEILEIIKHFFAVPHVHFVLGVNLRALENSVKARYGVEIDATAYLQKFLSFSLNLPDDIGDYDRTPSTVKYVGHIGAAMEIPNHLLIETCEQFKILGRVNHISIRDAGKILSTISLLPEAARNDRLLLGYRIATVTLIIARVIRPDLFSKFLCSSISDEELINFLGATDEYIKEFLEDGEQNKNFNRDVFHLHLAWTYILRNGVAGTDENLAWMSKYFDRISSSGNAKKMPRKIFDEWISVFKLA